MKPCGASAPDGGQSGVAKQVSKCILTNMTKPATRLRRADRRAQIAAAALDLIGEEGIQALTAARIADRVGVTSGALFRHFESREEILAEAVETAHARLAATFPAEDTAPLERLAQLAQARIALLDGTPGIAWLLRSDQARLALPTSGVTRLQDIARRSRAYILAALEEGVAEGRVRDDLPPTFLLRVFTATVHALAASPPRAGDAPTATGPAEDLAHLLTLLRPCGANSA